MMLNWVQKYESIKHRKNIYKNLSNLHLRNPLHFFLKSNKCLSKWKLKGICCETIKVNWANKRGKLSKNYVVKSLSIPADTINYLIMKINNFSIESLRLCSCETCSTIEINGSLTHGCLLIWKGIIVFLSKSGVIVINVNEKEEVD